MSADKFHTRPIAAFNANISTEAASRILHADVANDSRLVHASGHSVPVSELYLVLSKLVSLRRLRVFERNRTRPMKDFILGARFTVEFEKAMFPSGRVPQLDSYELYLSPLKSSARIFQGIADFHKARNSPGSPISQSMGSQDITWNNIWRNTLPSLSSKNFSIRKVPKQERISSLEIDI
ncbi:hypothetical protein LENED_010032 [Lentinula edodes]|uniref:Uncharacterized protein n=1 Tax=Lentinula edodes TaxID=5353 RepID=A0A1Q3ELC8_LENED|nr:hypothetical protein LENED_010032 [Lentinula edodes]